MEKQGASVHLLTSLYDIAWLLNVRGGDIDYVPVVLSYLALTEEQCFWFVQDAVLTDELRAYLAENRIETRPYESFYDYAAAIPAGETVLLDKGVCNYRLVSELCEGVEIVDETNPSVLMKSIKNETEQKNTVNAHIKDGVAVTKFIYWLKKNIGKTPMTELSASDYLAARRAEQKGFLDLSFDTICAYGAHAAIIHYAPTPETDIPLEAHGLLLVDSGGHYLEGTTDITRTIALGPVTDAERADFTRVLRSHLHLANARFLHGCTGLNLDILAREPLWEADLDYKHGTGHGVGHILNVHEGPNGFRWRQSPERSEGSVLEEGMITTDEPGLYIEDAYGIRIESELLCRKGVKNEFGQFMYFQNLTCAPIDLDAIDVNALTVTERRWLNEYHAAVYETVAPHLTEDERLAARRHLCHLILQVNVICLSEGEHPCLMKPFRKKDHSKGTGVSEKPAERDPYEEAFESDQDRKLPQPPLVKAPMADESERIALTRDFSGLALKNDLVSLIRDRRSARIYTNETMTPDELSFLLWATQGIKKIRGKAYATIRTVPCGGARHEFETHLIVRTWWVCGPARTTICQCSMRSSFCT